MRTLIGAPRFSPRSTSPAAALAPMLGPGEFATYGLAPGHETAPSYEGPGLEVQKVTREELGNLKSVSPPAASGVIVHNLAPVPVPLPPPDGVRVLWLAIDGQPVFYPAGSSPPPSSTGRTLLYLGVGALVLYALTR